MITNFKVLLLDDEERWLAQHERRLSRAGIEFRSTQDGSEAINIAKTDPSIKYALIDEILYAPASSLSEARELQDYQGSGVIRQITAQRSDIQIIVVTAAPRLQSNGDLEAFRRETQKLRRQRGVIDIIHKVDIDEDADQTYHWMIELFKRPRPAASAHVITRKVLVGLGFPQEIHAAISEQSGLPKKQLIPIGMLLKQGDRAKLLKTFWEKAVEKSILLEMPGSKTFDWTDIKPDSSAFQILAFLAQQAETHSEVIIHEHNYKHSSRKSSKVESYELPEVDLRSAQDYALDYHESGGRRIRHGIQIETRSEQHSALKVAISRLKDRLSDLNVGAANQLFIFEKDGYRPQFELGIVAYEAKSNVKART